MKVTAKYTEVSNLQKFTYETNSCLDFILLCTLKVLTFKCNLYYG